MTIPRSGKASLRDVEWRDLTVLHWHGGEATDGVTGCLPAVAGVFLIGTCQRRVYISMGRDAADQAQALVPADGNVERFASRDAYAFLLRFAAGLESKLAGETEIFGQLKSAWQQFGASGDALVRELGPLMQKLFEDTKQVRAQYLAGLGSASYGSLVRRLLADSHERSEGGDMPTAEQGANPPRGATLIVGAGQLAQSVAPWLVGRELAGEELWIWNRSATRAAELERLLVTRHPGCQVRVLDSTSEAELQAWSDAHDVVVCAPLDPARDVERVAARRRGAQAGRVIHLGGQDFAGTPWQELNACISLAAVFGLLQEHNDLRRRQIERARRVCGEKALLRSLGGSATQAHGWEDLLAFGSL